MKMRRFIQDIPSEAQNTIMKKLQWLCSNLDEAAKIIGDCLPKIKRTFPKLDHSVARVNPLPRPTPPIIKIVKKDSSKTDYIKAIDYLCAKLVKQINTTNFRPRSVMLCDRLDMVIAVKLYLFTLTFFGLHRANDLLEAFSDLNPVVALIKSLNLDEQITEYNGVNLLNTPFLNDSYNLSVVNQIKNGEREDVIELTGNTFTLKIRSIQDKEDTKLRIGIIKTSDSYKGFNWFNITNHTKLASMINHVI